MRKPRYDFAYFKAYEFLHRYKIQTFPFDPLPIAAQNHWCIRTYEQLARELGVDVFNVVEAFGSYDAMTVYNNRNYAIAYNNGISLKARVMFTLMHEFGHIVCGHFTDFDISRIREVLSHDTPEHLYRMLEAEANCFAANAMAPDVLIEKAHLDSVDKLRLFCGLSKEAAEIRLSSYQVRHRPRLTLYDGGIADNLNRYVSKIRDMPPALYGATDVIGLSYGDKPNQDFPH